MRVTPGADSTPGFAKGEFPVRVRETFTSGMAVLLAFALCGFPEAMQAQEPSSPAQSQQQQQQQPPNSGVAVDPSRAPLSPPPAPEPQQPTTELTGPPQQKTSPTTILTVPQSQQQEHEPLGAAAAGAVTTAGGAASRPAGTAIAPAKQHQVRSFLIKLGAIAAAGAAIGTVYALSRGTSSVPPNSGR